MKARITDEQVRGLCNAIKGEARDLERLLTNDGDECHGYHCFEIEWDEDRLYANVEMSLSGTCRRWCEEWGVERENTLTEITLHELDVFVDDVECELTPEQDNLIYQCLQL